MQKQMCHINLTHLSNYIITNSVLHLSEIRNSSKPFNFLENNKDMKTLFYNDLSTLLSSINFHIIGIVIDKEFHKQKYGIMPANHIIMQ